MHKARFFKKEPEGFTRCLLCPHRCRIGEGSAGLCGVRRMAEGELYSANYGLCAAAHWDPVEKKPLYHFYPGQTILSLGTVGCNLACSFCQNWTLARGDPGPDTDAFTLSPQQVLEMLKNQGGPEKALGVAYTYNEPTVWYEFIYDTAQLLRRHGYRNVLVTNGFISLDALRELLPLIDAFNIDLKAFTDSFYRQYCRGALRPVLETVKLAASRSHVEITCLLIPALNDNPLETERLVDWLASVSPDIPLHFSRYFPGYQLDLPPTPIDTLKRAREIGERRLHYVYLGNVDLPGGSDTFCPRCGNLLISRHRYETVIRGLEGSFCQSCRYKVRLVLPAEIN